MFNALKPISEVMALPETTIAQSRDEWTGENYRQERAEARQRVNRKRPVFGKRKSA